MERQGRERCSRNIRSWSVAHFLITPDPSVCYLCFRLHRHPWPRLAMSSARTGDLDERVLRTCSRSQQDCGPGQHEDGKYNEMQSGKDVRHALEVSQRAPVQDDYLALAWTRTIDTDDREHVIDMATKQSERYQRRNCGCPTCQGGKSWGSNRRVFWARLQDTFSAINVANAQRALRKCSC